MFSITLHAQLFHNVEATKDCCYQCRTEQNVTQSTQLSPWSLIEELVLSVSSGTLKILWLC